MASVVRLSTDQHPPAQEDWVYISADRNGIYDGTSQSCSDKCFRAVSTSDLEDIIAQAEAWADSNGVAAIYVHEHAE